jgi:hypothetical protein
VPALVFGWFAFVEGFGIGGFVASDVASANAAVAIAVGLSVVAWLADRPGPLLGMGLVLLQWAVPAAMMGFGNIDPEYAVEWLATGVGGLLALGLAGRDLLVRGQRGNRAAVAAAVAATVAQVATPWFDPRLLIVAPLAALLGPPLPAPGAEEAAGLVRLVPDRLVTWSGVAVLTSFGLVFLFVIASAFSVDAGGPAGFAVLTVAPAGAVCAFAIAVWAGTGRPTPLLLVTAVVA